jgi:formylmethanofuran dehydrogenase subunit C
MALRLRLKTPCSEPLEVEGTLPETARDRSASELQRVEILCGSRRVALAEFFEVSGDPQDECLHWEGDLTGVHGIGAGMARGTVHVHGNAGRHAGREMSGGQLRLEGSTGDWLGAEMQGGLIHVRGSAGHQVGAAYRGSPRGMTGGTILVEGSAGNEIGHTMRRGLIAVGGAGDAVGFHMLAGTVMVFGPSGVRHGAAMRRGTIAFVAEGPTPLPSFRYACRFQPPALRLLLRHLRRLGYPPAAAADCPGWDLFNGDLLEGGRGEFLVPAAA